MITCTCTVYLCNCIMPTAHQSEICRGCRGHQHTSFTFTAAIRFTLAIQRLNTAAATLGVPVPQWQQLVLAATENYQRPVRKMTAELADALRSYHAVTF